VRKALWWKLEMKVSSTKLIERVKGIYTNVKITVKLGDNRALKEFK
jgi:hypothetical protein